MKREHGERVKLGIFLIILIVFHHACDQGDLEVAQQLIQVLEMMLSRRPVTLDSSRRSDMENLVAGHERLWHLRRPNSDELMLC